MNNFQPEKAGLFAVILSANGYYTRTSPDRSFFDILLPYILAKSARTDKSICLLPSPLSSINLCLETVNDTAASEESNGRVEIASMRLPGHGDTDRHKQRFALVPRLFLHLLN